jgi:hypothetical protein
MISEDQEYCYECEELAERYLNSHYDNAIKQLKSVLSDEKRKDFESKSRDSQERIIDRMIEKGYFKWSIGE